MIDLDIMVDYAQQFDIFKITVSFIFLTISFCGSTRNVLCVTFIIHLDKF